MRAVFGNVFLEGFLVASSVAGGVAYFFGSAIMAATGLN
jgi:hypothetical protein